MLRRLVVVCTILQVVAVGACNRSPTEPAASASAVENPASAIAAPASQASLAGGRQDVLVNMLDACDPDSFNAVLGPGTCIRSGGVTFDQFIAQLTRLAFSAPWRFAPQNTNVHVGQTFVAENKGGEAHTFTEVEEFGGGIVPTLNQLAHTPTIAPECTTLQGDDFVAPGGAYREEVEHTGTLKFQCCIHPWMRLEAKASTR
jgi:plastocyanin